MGVDEATLVSGSGDTSVGVLLEQQLPISLRMAQLKSWETELEPRGVPVPLLMRSEKKELSSIDSWPTYAILRSNSLPV